MSDEADQAGPGRNHVDLCLPESRRVITEDVEQRIILDRREWNLEHVANEIRHYRAAAATLGLEMSDVRHGHVVGERESVEPVLPPIHDARPESFGPQPTTTLVT